MKIQLRQLELMRAGRNFVRGGGSAAVADKRRRQGRPIGGGSKGALGFTMVEIAICIAVIAIALVAILGVMPSGIQVQQSNREDTIIQDDGKYWLQIIGSGARNMDQLTNYIDFIQVSNGFGPIQIYTNSPALGNRSVGNVQFHGYLTNGDMIVDLLSLPKYMIDQGRRYTNVITAHVRAINGDAVGQSVAGRPMAFSYMMSPQIVPLATYTEDQTNFNAPGLNAMEITQRSNTWFRAVILENNAYNIRLTLRWPAFLKSGQWAAGTEARVFRTTVAGRYVTDTNALLSYLQPGQFEFLTYSKGKFSSP